MINFGKLAKVKSNSAATSLLELFDQLDRKATHESLRPVQIEASKALDQQLNEKDIVLKVSTGSGKTVIGLLYAEFMRRRYPGELVLYVCPTTQLVDQIVQTGPYVGINVEAFAGSGIPHKALEGTSILACTYDRLFNARNTFANNGIVPSAIVFDDVHAGIDRVRHAYTAKVPNEAYAHIRAIFQPLCEETDPAIWRGIGNNEPDARYEVPFWIWQVQCAAVARILDDYRDDNTEELFFCWANVSRYVEHARLCISGTEAELSLLIPAVEENPAYAGAKHRLFMSASIKDGGSLIRELGCNENAFKRVVEPESDKGAGERMVLPLALVDAKLDKSSVAKLCHEFSAEANVVVLTSSAKQAESWVNAGAVAQRGNQVDDAVADLRTSEKGRFYVFPQRFDGVDLPDGACRVLVIDGTPSGERLCDQIDTDRQKNSPGHNLRTVNRFEQALGRAVRSSADFAAILLVGSDIAAFVGRRDVKALLEPHTQEQIDLGKTLAEQLSGDGNTIDAIRAAISALLSRDEGWKDAHRERIASVQRVVRGSSDLTLNERAAVAERAAWMSAKSRNNQAAMTELQGIIGDVDLHPKQKAELSARMAGYIQHFDPARAAAVYRGAFELNNMLPRPPQMPDKKYLRIRAQAASVQCALQEFTNVSGAIARLEEVRAKLAYAGDAESVEQGLCELGELLGAASSRPEKETGRGPDVLWIFDDIALCIEAKSKKGAPIFKSDAEQLLMSIEWCKAQTGTGEYVVPVFATNSLKFDRVEDSTFGPLFLTETGLMGVIEQMRLLLNGVSFDGPLFNDASKLQQKLGEVGLTGKQIAAKLTKIK
jgi:hypothetical protein